MIVITDLFGFLQFLESGHDHLAMLLLLDGLSGHEIEAPHIQCQHRGWVEYLVEILEQDHLDGKNDDVVDEDGDCGLVRMLDQGLSWETVITNLVERLKVI